MKKLVIPLLMILLNILSGSLFSQTNITLTIGTIQAIPGQLVTIPVSISGANGANAIGVGQFYIFHTNGITKSGTGTGFTYNNLTSDNEWMGNLNYNSTTISNTWMSANFNDVSFPNGYVLFNIKVYYSSSDTVFLTWGTSGLTETLVDNNLGTLYGTVNFNFVGGKIIPASPQPAVPSLLSPSNNSTGVSLVPVLVWQSAVNATSYRVQLSTSSSFNTLTVDETTTQTSRALSNLSYSTTYYWRVKSYNAIDSSDWTAVWSFTTRQAPPATPALSTPSNNSTGVSLSPVLVWQSAVNATSYRVQLSTSSSFNTLTVDETTTQTSRSLSNLSYSTTYYWRVKSYNAIDSSDWSAVWSFTTRQAPPATPVLSTPSNNSTGVSLSPVLVWQSAVNATSYRVQLSTSSSFNTLTVDETTTQTSRALSNLSYSTTYYWRVKSYNAIDSSDWSAVWNFTTRQAPPAAPVLISPSNGATALDTFTTLVWQSVANAIGYRVQLSTSSTFSTLIVNDSLTMINRTLTHLFYNTTYYWRVKSYTLSDSSDWATATFTTLSMSLPANWSFNSNTGNFAIIGLNPNGTYRIGDRYISNGDAIGVFYLDSIYEKCAGYMIWNGQNYGIVVWGDDDFTQNIKEGYSLGETYIIKVWNAQTLTEHYSDYRIQSGPNAYQPNGITIIDSIGAIVKITHTIPLNNGWNMISSYVLPDSSNISYLLAPLNQNLQIMRNMFGLVYSPQVVNTLNQWSRFHAYQIRVAGQTSLPIYGVRLYPQALPLFLTTNWYWMPYPRTSSMQLTTAMSSVLNKILQVKTITGQVYHPPFFNTLQTLEPGKGYMIKMTQGARFVFPPNSAIKSSALSNSFAEPSVFVRKNHISGKTAVLPMEIADIQDGDEVGVFTCDGLLVGSSVWQEGLRGVVVWGDDEFTPEKDGAYEGEELVVKVWSHKNKTIGSVRIAETRNYSDGESTQSLKYETDAILLLKGAVEYKTTSLAITPQPASEELFITYSNFSGEAVEIDIFNQNGSLMLHKSQNPTGGAVKLDISRLPNGVYFVTLRNGAFFAKERFVIVR